MNSFHGGRGRGMQLGGSHGAGRSRGISNARLNTYGVNSLAGQGGYRMVPRRAREGYEDDLGYAGKRPIDELDPMGVKRQRTSSVQMMNMMIQDSQRELANLTFNNTSRHGGDHLSQVLNKQQMLLEMQSEMIAGMGDGEEPYGRIGGRQIKSDYDNPYMNVQGASSGMHGPKRGMMADHGRTPLGRIRDDLGSGTRARGRGAMAMSTMGVVPKSSMLGMSRDTMGSRSRGPMRGTGGNSMSARGMKSRRGNEINPIRMRGGYQSRGQMYNNRMDKEEYDMYDFYNPYLDYEYGESYGAATPAPEYYVSIEGKLNNFIKILFEYVDLKAPVQAIETTRHDNTDFVKIRTEYLVTEDLDKDPYIDGHLKMNGVVLARKQGYTKHQVKDEVYAEAMYNLLTKSVSEIFSISNKLYKKMPDEIKSLSKDKANPGKRDHKFILSRLKGLVTTLREEFPETYGRGSKENLIHEIDVACGNCDAGITLVFKKNGDSITCDLYADDLMLGSGEEADKRAATRNAYRNSKRLLMNWNNPVDRIIRENKRLQDVKIMDPSILDVQYKGRNHERGSNLNLLKTTCADTYATDILNKRDVIAYEHADEPSTMPYKVLEDTACSNRMLLEFVTYCANEGGPTRCLIFLQGDLIADAMGFNRIKAKANAANKAIHYLRTNCTVIQTSARDYTNITLSFSEAKEKALLLKADEPELARDWDLSNYPEPVSDDSKPDDLSPWVDQVLENIVADFSKTEGLEELIFDKDFPRFHILRLKELSKKYPIHVVIKKGDDKAARTNCSVVQKSFLKKSSPIDVVNLLKKLNNKSGRFKLIQWKDENGTIVKC
ncbi:uncharacterized protein LOC126808592 isoform X2 [Patella vulgata]|uniref:uncharacterized protein LOC126808592 isoform X2 n=1 Tax=Patella vulgata TaxID=6465 RepID=UPI00217FD70F|nr:uncharacterized protein LOC126808592 isoform X2 [Patella vulgata]